MEEILALSARAQARKVQSREITASELVEAHLRRIETDHPVLNAAIEIFGERAREEAVCADRELASGSEVGPLHGVPFSVKDSLEVAGTRCTAGTVGRSRALLSTRDATVVSRLREAGGIPIAKTNLPDLLFAFETENFLFGRTNNPYDVSRTAGGSSGGEAALVASGGSPLGLGSDCAGSVRVPAAFCGIASMKPTSGRLPRTGHIPPAGGWIEALWQIGPMARFTDDVALALELMAGTDGADWTAADVLFVGQPYPSMRGLRIAIHTDNGVLKASEEVAAAVRDAARALSETGAVIEESRPSCLDESYELEMKLLGADGGDAVRNYASSMGSTHLHPLLTAWLEKLEPYRTDLRGFGSYWGEWDKYRAAVLSFFARYDAILCPVYPETALAHGTSTLDACFPGFSYTMAYNLAGLPAAVVRCGTSASGMPIGVQIVSRAWREDVALSIAAALERALGGWRPAPDYRGA